MLTTDHWRAREATVNGGVNPPLRGDKHGQSVRQEGRGNVRKRGGFRGFLGAKGGAKRRILGLESRKKRRFLAFGRGNWRAHRDFRARSRHYVSANARPKSTPRDDATREKAESPCLARVGPHLPCERTPTRGAPTRSSSPQRYAMVTDSSTGVFAPSGLSRLALY